MREGAFDRNNAVVKLKITTPQDKFNILLNRDGVTTRTANQLILRNTMDEKSVTFYAVGKFGLGTLYDYKFRFPANYVAAIDRTYREKCT